MYMTGAHHTASTERRRTLREQLGTDRVVCICIYIYRERDMCMHLSLYVYIYIYIYICVYIYIYVCVCVCVCVLFCAEHMYRICRQPMRYIRYKVCVLLFMQHFTGAIAFDVLYMYPCSAYGTHANAFAASHAHAHTRAHK